MFPVLNVAINKINHVGKPPSITVLSQLKKEIWGVKLILSQAQYLAV